MPRASNGGIEIEYETTGDPADPALVLLNDLAGQLTAWDDDFVEAFVDRGFFVVRLDNRDSGLSTRTPRRVDVAGSLRALYVGTPADVPYRLDEMAADVVAVLDDLGIARAHVFGASFGGSIAQTVAIRFPDRVATLTTVMASTGETSVGQARPDVLPYLVNPGPTDREGAVEHGLRFWRIVGSPDHFEEARARRRLENAYDRSFHPEGAGIQMLAGAASGDRVAGLSGLDVPTLVIHGDRDPLVDVSGGRRVAQLVPGAELLVLEGMGHDLPTSYWPMIVESVTKLASRTPSGT